MTEIAHRYQGTAVPDLTFPPREGGYPKGHETREEILRAALRILIEEGYRAMSMRRIAAQCGMKLGNLTYHFPNREDLVQALLDAVITSYEIEFANIFHDPSTTPEQRLELYCELVLEDIRSKKTTRLFPELWALSNHDTFVFERVHDLYRRARAPLEDVIAEMRPDLAEPARHDIALFISASMEGLTVFAGYAKPFESRMQSLEAVAARAFLDVVRNFVAPADSA
ncbi:MAG: TetR/AcrR family transcriptional regulator [Sphingomonadales bacterium]|nr:TetR/AcrR family transcriptional regulator [Sphingomonadales bacterium]